MKIALITELYPAGKFISASSAELVASNLRRFGHKVIIFAPGKPRGEAHVRRVSGVSAPALAPYHYSLPGRVDLDFMANQDFDLIHSFSMFKMGWFGIRAGRELSLPVIFTYSTLLNKYLHYLPLGKRTFFASRLRLYLDQHTRDYCKNVAKIIVPSKPIKRHLENLGVQTPIELLPPPIKISNFLRAGAGSLRKKYKIKKGKKVILYVGRVDYNKNIEFLLDFFKKLTQKIPKAVLIVAGEGSARADLRARTASKKFPRVIWAGFVGARELPKYYRLADLVVYPERNFSRGTVILESLASSTPIIAASSPASRSLISNGKTGFVLPLRQNLFLTTALRIFSSPNLRLRMARASSKVIKKYSVSKMTKQLIKIYQKTLSEFTNIY